MPSPAERKAEADRRAALGRSALGRFAALQDFPLDDFQVRACQEIEAGRGVLVAAPTGSWPATSGADTGR